MYVAKMKGGIWILLGKLAFILVHFSTWKGTANQIFTRFDYNYRGNRIIVNILVPLVNSNTHIRNDNEIVLSLIFNFSDDLTLCSSEREKGKKELVEQ